MIDGVEHYFDAGTEGGADGGNATPASGPRIDLIQCYDEYVMGYSATRHYLCGSAPAFPVAGDPIHVVLLDGRMAGCWRHTMFSGRCELDIRLVRCRGPGTGRGGAGRRGPVRGLPGDPGRARGLRG
ncbi:DNA glycosylase AlkZ-like family protein [Pseudarthrobacter cellobiosi]|uniref:DNA glycosylase AlkZ-like family protein n=1 Tax=Pseudarthrobacter cellobiosi TaxID=2953654 RepID=UPI00208DFCA1|nr:MULTISPECIES: crosslink repair DNA glycosylase YcaQ family protein [unclassified Pseudarthrobacter]MCO4254961.1 winged helix DNA-binding domain-containing protein [Pseudarthrobacter sp. HLT1-5]MCO4273721.1 winged helix DNA-binding domain-containing protein [Pseudarthrobacter sp. HLT3-5]